jgi:glycosyltransferase involved in cell wall biosynthesis
MIRVLHIVNIMNRGGLETMIMNLYKNIDRTKVQFDFLTHSTQPGDYDNEIKELGGNIYSVVSRRQGILKNRRQLMEFFKKHPEYNIVHMHVSSLSYITPLKIATMGNVSTRVIHSHSSKHERGSIHKLLHMINQRKIKKYATNYFACSNVAAKWLYGDRLYNELDIHLINNSIDAQKFSFNEEVRNIVRKKLNIEDNFVIGHVGRFTDAKNHIFLIDIFKEIHNIYPNSVLMLVGRGELENEIKNRVIKLGLEDSVMFMGVRSDIPELLQAMDVFLFPSLYEGLPVTLVEAQAAGLRIIASDSITKEIDLTGLVQFVSLRQPASEWAKEVLNYLNGYERKDTFDIISKAGYDVKTLTKELVQFYLSKTYKLKGFIKRI